MSRLSRLRRRPSRPAAPPAVASGPGLARVERLVALVLGAGLIVLVVAVFFALSAPREGEGTPAPTAAAAAPADSFLARIVPSPPGASPAATRDLRSQVARLSLEERAAQVMLVAFAGRDARSEVVRRVRSQAPGGLVVGPDNDGGRAALRELTNAVERAARRRRAVPPLIVTAQEGGEFSSLAGLPPRRAPGDTQSVREAAREARRSARALRALGIDGVLGPVIDVGPEDGGAIGRRAYSDDPRAVAAFARAAVRAYRRAGLLSAPAHFPGLGAASAPTEEGPATVGLSIDELRRRDLRAFVAAFDAGAPAVVVGHGLYASDDFAVPASQSPFILTELLRQELGFRGVAITDDLGEGAIARAQSIDDAAVTSLRAGADMVQVFAPVDDQRAVRDAIVRAVREGRLPAERLEEAVLRVLVAKRAARAKAP